MGRWGQSRVREGFCRAQPSCCPGLSATSSTLPGQELALLKHFCPGSTHSAPSAPAHSQCSLSQCSLCLDILLPSEFSLLEPKETPRGAPAGCTCMCQPRVFARSGDQVQKTWALWVEDPEGSQLGLRADGGQYDSCVLRPGTCGTPHRGEVLTDHSETEQGYGAGEAGTGPGLQGTARGHC